MLSLKKGEYIMDNALFMKNLSVPTERIDAILDTDAYNEIDDQFAIAYMLLSVDRINTKAICAAPFFNSKSISPKDGMEKSFDEIQKLLSLIKLDYRMPLYKGSEMFMRDEATPIISDAARYMADEAEKYTPENPLYIVAIGAITNVASACLLNPQAMKKNTVIVWLGGNAHTWPDTKEFNMEQDVAARVVFNCGAPIVQLPCMGVVSAFTTTKPELEYWLLGKNPLATYLAENAIREAEAYASGRPWSRCIWDVTAVAWLLNDNSRFLDSYLTPIPLPQYDNHYSFNPHRQFSRYIYNVRRDALFFDLFTKIANGGK